MIWFFNMLLYFVFITDYSAYHQMVADGQPCWVQASAQYLPTHGLGDSGNVQPSCWYDPSNTNDGHSWHMKPASMARAQVRGAR